MDEITSGLKQAGFKGETDNSPATLDLYSHDASMFELRPKLIVKPEDAKDVEKLVKLVAAKKKTEPRLSLTARSAGTDMSGGAINDSIIVDFREHFRKIEKVTGTSAQAQPGVLYRDFEPQTLKHKALMPTYPASRDLASIGGMVNNNSGGEKSLEFGKTEDFVTELKFVFADGIERTVKPLKKPDLDKKMKQKDFEGEVYRKLFKLVDGNYDEIKAAKPHVTKNSTGYNLWDVWDRETGIFDLTKLIVGAQGTLGFVTDIHFRLVPARPHSGLLVLFMKNIDDLGEVIPAVLKSKPATFESFDDQTLWLSIRFMPSFLKLLGWKRFIHLLITLIPDGLQLLRGIPKEDVERGMVLAKPGSITPHTNFKGSVYVLSKEEGGRHTPFFKGYRPQFYFRTTDVTGVAALPAGTEMVMPGDNVALEIELITPVAMEKGLRFAIREGGRTVGAGTISEIIA